MLFLTEVAGFALRESLEAGSGSVLGMLTSRISNHGQRLTTAVQSASTSAWRALEISLAGESLWTKLDRADDKIFRQQIREYLSAMPLPLLMGKTEFCRTCLAELKKARKDPHLAAPLTQEGLSDHVGQLTQAASAQDFLNVEMQTLRSMAGKLEQQGFKSLGWLFQQQPQPNETLLIIAVRYFFRRRVEADETLARSLQFSQMESLTQAQKAGFDHLDTVLAQHHVRLDEALDGLLLVVGEARDAALGAQEAARETRSTVLDLSSELQSQMVGVNAQVQGLYEPVMKLLESIEAQNQPVSPQHSLSIRTDREKELVRNLLLEYRQLPADQQANAPALLNGLGKLEVAVGDFEKAQETFEQVATITNDVRAKAEAHYNAYRAALETNDFDDALRELQQAIAGDAEQYAPFPTDEYEAEKILGAGGFGVTFLCKHKLYGGLIAVKALLVDDLDRDVAKVFEEAQTLDQLNHSAIIRLRHCGFADSARKRPYLVMDFFDGQTLEDYIQQHGELSTEQFYPLAIKLADALQAAHSQNILHRDIKPANILVRPTGGDWEIRVIDFGLALKQEVLENATSTLRKGHTITGEAIAGTLEYAAPEQMGKLPGTRVDAPADVYGFARTCCYALFEVPEPTFQNWQQIPQPLAELLGECLNKKPENRPASFRRLVQRLNAMAPQRGGNPPAIPTLSEAVPPLPELTPVVPVDEPAVPEVRPVRRRPPEPEVVEPDEKYPPRRSDHQRYANEDPPAVSSSANAQRAVRVPGLLMMLTGIFAFGCQFALAAYAFSGASGPTDYTDVGTMFFITALLSGPAIGGGWQMMRLRSYTGSLIAAIALVFGGCWCFLLGPVVGIWAIMVLVRPEVKTAFQ